MDPAVAGSSPVDHPSGITEDSSKHNRTPPLTAATSAATYAAAERTDDELLQDIGRALAMGLASVAETVGAQLKARQLARAGATDIATRRKR